MPRTAFAAGHLSLLETLGVLTICIVGGLVLPHIWYAFVAVAAWHLSRGGHLQPILWVAPAILIAILLITPAFAQGTTVPVSPIYNLFIDTIMPPLAVVVSALLGWLALTLQKKTGLQIEAAHREALQTAIMNGAGLLAQKVGGKVAGMNINVGNPMVALAVQYVENAAPDALKRFGLTGEEIAEKLAAKLGVAMISAPAPIATVAAKPTSS